MANIGEPKRVKRYEPIEEPSQAPSKEEPTPSETPPLEAPEPARPKEPVPG